MRFWPFFFILLSCSNTYYPPETISQKMGRYHALEEVEVKESYPLAMDLMNYEFKGRAPASVSPETAKKKDSKESKDSLESLSNKKIYFLTLWHQYERLKNFLGSPMPRIETCAQFHSNTLEFPLAPSQPEKLASLNNEKMKNERGLFPEMALPLFKESPHPTVWENLEQNPSQNILPLIEKALTHHLEKTHEELLELCEYGQGRNYFVFENLIDYMENHPHFKESKASMQALLKTSIISNMALIVSLESHLDSSGRKLASSPFYSQLTQSVAQRLRAEWSLEYFKELERRRRGHKGGF